MVASKFLLLVVVSLFCHTTLYYNGCVQSLTNSFESASLVFSSTATKTPLDFNITFRLTRTLGSKEDIAVRLPRFTQNLDAKNFSITYGNISFGDLIVAPSYLWEAAWIEGVNEIQDDFDSEVLPYRTSELRLRTRFNGSLSAGTQQTITIFKENKIGAFCGFPSSQTLNSSRNLLFPFKRFEIYTVQDRIMNVSDVLYNITVAQNDTYPIDFWNGIGNACSELSSCNLQGRCDYCLERCHCFDGYGSSSDLVNIGRDLQPDCSSRICPSGKAVADFPTSSNKAHAMAECSNRGVCDRKTGQCKCASPFAGAACDRLTCPNDCSGHGRCLSMAEIARKRAEENPSAYTIEYGTSENLATSAWDHDVIFGCQCDSSWEVGYFDGQTQLSEFFGADCSLKRCPSGDNPFTSVDETDCTGVSQLERIGIQDPEVGAFKNKCYVACSNRGICDNRNGNCQCFEGSWGVACEFVANSGREELNLGRNLSNATVVEVQYN